MKAIGVITTTGFFFSRCDVVYTGRTSDKVIQAHQDIDDLCGRWNCKVLADGGFNEVEEHHYTIQRSATVGGRRDQRKGSTSTESYATFVHGWSTLSHAPCSVASMS